MTTWHKSPPLEPGGYWVKRRFHARWKTTLCEVRPVKSWQPQDCVCVRIVGVQYQILVSKTEGSPLLQFSHERVPAPEEREHADC